MGPFRASQKDNDELAALNACDLVDIGFWGNRITWKIPCVGNHLIS